MPVGDAPATVAVNVTAWPASLGLSDEARAVLVPAMSTPWVNNGDTLASLLLSPPYSAVIECEPVASDEVVIVATPLLSGAVPSTVTPSLKVTVPVGGGAFHRRRERYGLSELGRVLRREHARCRGLCVYDTAPLTSRVLRSPRVRCP